MQLQAKVEQLEEFADRLQVPGDEGLELPVPLPPVSAEWEARLALQQARRLASSSSNSSSTRQGRIHLVTRASSDQETSALHNSLGRQAVADAAAVVGALQGCDIATLPEGLVTVLFEVVSVFHHPLVYQQTLLRRLLERLQPGDALVFPSPDRAARLGQHLELLLQACSKLGVAVFVAAVGRQAPLPLIPLELGGMPVPEELQQPLVTIRRHVLRLLDLAGWSVTMQHGQITAGQAYMAHYCAGGFDESAQALLLQHLLDGKPITECARVSPGPMHDGDARVLAGAATSAKLLSPSLPRQVSMISKLLG
jgi:hypothetical protein